MKTLLEKFMAKVIKAESGCWEWQGKLSNGYGRFGGMNAHRWHFIQLNGIPLKGWHIDHLCRNRACVNPEHLEAVTAAENIRRGAPFRVRKTHCRYGHKLSPDPSSKGKYCQLCNKVSDWKNYKRKTGRNDVIDVGTFDRFNRNMERYTAFKISLSPGYRDFIVREFLHPFYNFS